MDAIFSSIPAWLSLKFGRQDKLAFRAKVGTTIVQDDGVGLIIVVSLKFQKAKISTRYGVNYSIFKVNQANTFIYLYLRLH